MGLPSERGNYSLQLWPFTNYFSVVIVNGVIIQDLQHLLTSGQNCVGDYLVDIEHFAMCNGIDRPFIDDNNDNDEP